MFCVICSNSFYDPPTPETCIPIPRHNVTIIPDFYAGIPANLLLNLIGFVVSNSIYKLILFSQENFFKFFMKNYLQFLVSLFGLLRKKAWNYGRLALLHKTDNRWMELFYGDNEGAEADVSAMEASVNTQLSHIDRGFLTWIVTAFRVTLVQLKFQYYENFKLLFKISKQLIEKNAGRNYVEIDVENSFSPGKLRRKIIFWLVFKLDTIPSLKFRTFLTILKLLRIFYDFYKFIQFIFIF